MALRPALFQPATTTRLKFESKGGTAFSIVSRSVTPFLALYSASCSNGHRYIIQICRFFVGRSLTKREIIVDTFSPICVFPAHINLCISKPVPAGIGAILLPPRQTCARSPLWRPIQRLNYVDRINYLYSNRCLPS